MATAPTMIEDECNDTEGRATIDCLPSEIVIMILKHMNSEDIANFSATCRYFFNLVQNDQYLWKTLFKDM